MRHKHKVRQTIIHYLLSFVLMLCIVVAVVAGVGKLSCLSERSVQHAATKTHYYYELKNEMEQLAMDAAVPYGINKADLRRVFQDNEVQSDVDKVFSERLNNQKEIIDVSNIEKRIRTNVEKREGKLTSSQTKSLNSYIKKMQKMYMEKLHYPTEKIMVDSINNTNKLAWIAIPLSIVLGFFVMFYLVVSRHYAYHGIRYVVYGFIGAGTLITVGFAAIISNGSIYNYNLTASYVKNFYVYYIGHPLLISVIFGISTLVLGFIGIFIVYRQKYAIRR